MRLPTSNSGSTVEHELERRTIERQPILFARDTERLAEPPRPRAKQAIADGPASRAHLVEAARRLERPQQNGGGKALRLADEIQAPVHAVRPVDVGVATRQEHRAVPRRAAVAVRMRRLVVRVVGLDLDDHPADAVDVQLRADQLPRDVEHRPLKELRVHAERL